MASQLIDPAIQFMVIAIVVTLVIVPIIIFLVLMKLGVFAGKPHEGDKTKATVLLVEPETTSETTGMTNLKLVLEVRPHGANPYEVRIHRKVPATQAESLFQDGQVLDIVLTGHELTDIAIIGFDAVPNSYVPANLSRS
jgi:hypothetical protein